MARISAAILLGLLAYASPSVGLNTQSAAQEKPPSQKSSQTAPAAKLTVIVTDQNRVAVPSAHVKLQLPPPLAPQYCETDFSGHCEFNNLNPGPAELSVEKPGFYAVTQPNVQLGMTSTVELILTRQQEAHEVVNVTEAAPPISPDQIASKEEVTGTEIIDIPYPGTHDYRNALVFVPGVTPDAFGQLHIAGAETYQHLVLLDGFNVSQPTNGQLLVRSSVDSFRSIEVTPSREPAEYGKGSGGVLALNTRMGDDHFRTTSTDFIPGVQDINGISFSQWNPILTLSGPIRKGKTWFIDALNGQYDNNLIQQLPSYSDFDHVWRIDNLAKLQSNFTTRNIMTLSFLSNYYHDLYDGLSFLQPQLTTPTDTETAYIGSAKDQYYFHGGALLETGFGVSQYSVNLVPQGSASYIQLVPSASFDQSSAGNYYLHENTLARRVQGLTNLYVPPFHAKGRHEIKTGLDVDRLNYNAEFLRQPISFLQPGYPVPGQTPQPCPTDANGIPIAPSPTCARYSVFNGGGNNTIYNTEAAAYVEDKWSITNRFFVEPGVRVDWDQTVRTPLVSPRLAGTFALDNTANTKISAGIGILYDVTPLGLLHQPYEGQRGDYFFNSSGNPTDQNGNPIAVPTPVPTTFSVNPYELSAPRYINWSVALEKKLPYAIFLKLEFLEKRGTHGFAYNTANGLVDGNFLFGNTRDDRYDAIEVSVHHRFHQYYEIFGAYTRSTAHTNQVFDFSLDVPLLSPQLPGPYPWDTPNRFVGWGIIPGPKLPAVHKFDIVYSTEVRTGLPFLATTDQGEIYPGIAPGTFRLPTYYTINLQFEKRFHFFGRYWAVRAGFNNVTNHANAALANGVLDPTHPTPTFIDQNSRAFTGRIRFLGKQ